MRDILWEGGNEDEKIENERKEKRVRETRGNGYHQPVLILNKNFKGRRLIYF